MELAYNSAPKGRGFSILKEASYTPLILYYSLLLDPYDP